MLAHVHVIIEALRKNESYSAFFAQPRRIACEYCHDTFVYLFTGKVKVTVQAWRWTDDAEVAAKGRGELQKKIEKTTKKAQLGAGLCPHCHWYQSWMVKRSRRGPIGMLAGIGSVLGAVFGLGWLIYENESHRFSGEPPEFWWIAAGLGAGLLFGVSLSYMWGSLFGLTHGAQPEKVDPGSITNKEWAQLTGARSPVKAWIEQRGVKTPSKADLWPLPLRDETVAPP